MNEFSQGLASSLCSSASAGREKDDPQSRRPPENRYPGRRSFFRFFLKHFAEDIIPTCDRLDGSSDTCRATIPQTRLAVDVLMPIFLHRLPDQLRSLAIDFGGVGSKLVINRFRYIYGDRFHTSNLMCAGLFSKLPLVNASRTIIEAFIRKNCRRNPLPKPADPPKISGLTSIEPYQFTHRNTAPYENAISGPGRFRLSFADRAC